MAEPLSYALQLSQIRLRSITAGLTDHLAILDSITCCTSAEEGVPVTTILRHYLTGVPRSVTVPSAHLLALARMESDHPARAPIAATPLQVPPAARGKTFDPEKDEVRLNDQLQAVLSLMKDGRWRTLVQVRDGLGGAGLRRVSEAGLSARLRDLRKPQYGGHLVERERVPETRGLWRYRLVP